MEGQRTQSDIFGYIDDVQKFERAIVSGKPFKTERSSRRVVKSGDNADDANDGSDPGSEEASDHEPPKAVRCNFAFFFHF